LGFIHLSARRQTTLVADAAEVKLPTGHIYFPGLSQSSEKN